jgi:DNA replication protein DnaC
MNYLKKEQIEDIQFFLKNFENKIFKYLLIGEPGCGKSMVFILLSLILLNQNKNSKILIISPKSNLF